MSGSTRHNIHIPDELWDQAAAAAVREMAKTGSRVTTSEWVRRAMAERLAAGYDDPTKED